MEGNQARVNWSRQELVKMSGEVIKNQGGKVFQSVGNIRKEGGTCITKIFSHISLKQYILGVTLVFIEEVYQSSPRFSNQGNEWITSNNYISTS